MMLRTGRRVGGNVAVRTAERVRSACSSVMLLPSTTAFASLSERTRSATTVGTSVGAAPLGSTEPLQSAHRPCHGSSVYGPIQQYRLVHSNSRHCSTAAAAADVYEDSDQSDTDTAADTSADTGAGTDSDADSGSVHSTGAAQNDASSMQVWTMRELVDSSCNASIAVKDDPAVCRTHEMPVRELKRFVQDIALRLEQQLQICDGLDDILHNDIQSHLNTPYGHGKNSRYDSSPKGRQTNQNSHSSPTPTRRNNEKKVISTSRHLTPYWWRSKQQTQVEHELEKARRSIHNLRILHRDTHQLCLHLDTMLSRQHDTLTRLHRRSVVETMQQLIARHANTIETVAEIVIGLRPVSQRTKLYDTVHRFLENRLGIQLLCDHVSSNLQSKKKRKSAVSTDVSLIEVIEDAVTEASHLCEASMLAVPTVHTVYDTDNEPRGNIIRPWLHYTLVELLKNAMAVTVENARQSTATDDTTSRLPPLYITVHRSVHQHQQYYDICIHDQGGGFSATKKQPDELFQFAQCSRLWDRLDDQTTYAMTRSPLRGLGVGLSLSRMMMRCFDGDLMLEERVDGQQTRFDLGTGCTATIRLNQDLDTPMTEALR